MIDEFKPYMVEELVGKGDFRYVGEYHTTAEIARAIGESPAKVHRAVKQFRPNQWNRYGNYRVGVRVKI